MLATLTCLAILAADDVGPQGHIQRSLGQGRRLTGCFGVSQGFDDPTVADTDQADPAHRATVAEMEAPADVGAVAHDNGVFDLEAVDAVGRMACQNARFTS